MSEEATNTESSEQVIKGRSVFLVETTPAGIAVQTALLTEEGKLLNAPAIFPDVEYAFTQVDELKRLISAHFSQAARLGAQVAAQQGQANAAPTELPTEPARLLVTCWPRELTWLTTPWPRLPMVLERWLANCCAGICGTTWPVVGS